MRLLLTSVVLLTLLVLSPASDAQEKPELQKLVSPLVGTWVSKSDVGSTMVRYRKDGWFISAHYFSAPFSLTSNSVWAVGHWALDDDSLILHRLAGSDGLELVPEKRQLALKELTREQLTDSQCSVRRPGIRKNGGRPCPNRISVVRRRAKTAGL